MSLYRKTVVDGILIRQKRNLIRFWIWTFNRSEEDYLIKMKNDLSKARAMVAQLSRRIPKEEDRLKQIKDGLATTGAPHSIVTRDVWMRRKEPIRLIEDVKVGRKKAKRVAPKPVKPLLNITPAQ